MVYRPDMQRFRWKNTQILMLVICLLMPVISFSCSNEKKDAPPIILKVNAFEMTKDEFNAICRDDMEYKETYKTSLTAQKGIIKEIIRKQLLIQQATQMGIDQDPNFIRAIQKYWEATLIKQLMERKNKEIEKTVLVSDTEIQKRYDTYKTMNHHIPPLKDIDKQIAAEILEEKKSKAFESWLTTLEKTSDIQINSGLLNE